MPQKQLLIIETDPTFIQKFHKNLKNQFLEDEYKIYQIIPQITEGKVRMLLQCIKEVSNLMVEDNIAAIFIDINLSEEERDNTGIELGNKIRELYNYIPIFSITSKYANDQDFDFICDASLEDFDGVIIKKYLTSDDFSAERLNTMLLKAQNKRKKQSEVYSVTNKQKVDVLVVCVVPKEFEALDLVFDFTENGKKEPYKIYSGIRFWKKKVNQNINSRQEIDIIFTLIGTAGNVLSALFSNMCYQYFSPKVSILCGIAAGNKNKIKIYSALVADAIVYYELQKLTSEKNVQYRLFSEPGPILATKDLPYIALRKHYWKDNFLKQLEKCELALDDFKNKAWVSENWKDEVGLYEGVIASGEKLLADGETLSNLEQLININKGVIAGEMESTGFARAARENNIPNWLIIRGISDYGGEEKLDPINDKYQKIAAISAASLVEEYVLNIFYGG